MITRSLLLFVLVGITAFLAGLVWGPFLFLVTFVGTAIGLPLVLLASARRAVPLEMEL